MSETGRGSQPSQMISRAVGAMTDDSARRTALHLAHTNDVKPDAHPLRGRIASVIAERGGESDDDGKGCNGVGYTYAVYIKSGDAECPLSSSDVILGLGRTACIFDSFDGRRHWQV